MDGMPPMQFEISPTADAPLRLNDIEADRFPELSGAVVVPQLGAGGTVTFAPIDVADLAVDLTCPGADGLPRTVSATLIDTVPGPQPDSYRFTPEALQLNDMFGPCTLEVRAPSAYTPATIDVTVSAGDGTSQPVLVRNIALVRPEDVNGRAFWVDRGLTPNVEVGAPGVTVRTQGAVIVGFDPGTEPPATGAPPSTVLAGPVELSTTTSAVAGAVGNWAFLDPKQVFGTSRYVFALAGQYQTRTISLTIDQNGRSAASVDPVGAPTPVIDGRGVGVQLDADGGDITATVNVVTIKGTPQFLSGVPDIDGFAMTAVGPTGGTATAVPAARAIGRATVVTTDPGTYVASMTIAPNHLPVPGEAQTGIAVPQAPGQDVGFTRTYVEQGAVAVSVVNRGTGTPIPGATIRLDHGQQPFPPGDPASSTRSCGPAPLTPCTATPTFTGLQVNSLDPLNRAVNYVVSLAAVPGFDVSAGTAVVTRDNGSQVACPVTACPVEVFAGGQPTVRFELPAFGTISGEVDGDNGSGTPEPLTLANGLVVTATRVLAEDCSAPTRTPLDGPRRRRSRAARALLDLRAAGLLPHRGQPPAVRGADDDAHHRPLRQRAVARDPAGLPDAQRDGEPPPPAMGAPRRARCDQPGRAQQHAHRLGRRRRVRRGHPRWEPDRQRLDRPGRHGVDPRSPPGPLPGRGDQARSRRRARLLPGDRHGVRATR